MEQTFVMPALERRGMDMNKIMREAALAQVREQVFQRETVAPKAQVLAHSLALTLNGKRPTAKDWQAEMLKGLTGVCQGALVLHGQLVASPDEYSCIWPLSG
ncbi:hypothetical protein LTR08_007076 [Meristemomyces frigidus]|nr:hypothetical protein LTR08_007076 [Meristemomyces frigidus]